MLFSSPMVGSSRSPRWPRDLSLVPIGPVVSSGCYDAVKNEIPLGNNTMADTLTSIPVKMAESRAAGSSSLGQ